MNKIKLVIAICITFFLFFAPIADADVSSKVTAWFQQQNYSNVTPSGVYAGQSARYATLGGVSTRNPITQPFQFINVQTPKFSAGCGGIDLFTGGFEAVNADRFVQNLRAIGQNAQSLAFMLAIQVVSPQLSGVMENIQTWADKYLNQSLDSCAAATALVGGAMDVMGASEGNCTVKRMDTFGETWAIANAKCTTEGERQSTEAAPGGANQVAFSEGNLAWHALMRDAYFKNDLQFAEVIMNLTGTLIITDVDATDDSGMQIRIITPAIYDDARKERFENIHTAMLLGNQSTDPIKIYNCTENRSATPEGCTKMSNDLVEIPATWDGLTEKINTLVSSISTKIASDTVLTAEEIGLIESSSFPLYKYLAVSTAMFSGVGGFDAAAATSEYTGFIAKDILNRALKAVLERYDSALANMDKGMSETESVIRYREGVKETIQGLAKLQNENVVDAADYYALSQRIQNYEKALMSRLSSGIMANVMWGV